MTALAIEGLTGCWETVINTSTRRKIKVNLNKRKHEEAQTKLKRVHLFLFFWTKSVTSDFEEERSSKNNPE